MSKDHSFDVVSEVSMMEIENAVVQAQKELAQRFDFKGSMSAIELSKLEKTITLKTENEYRLKALTDMLQGKCIKRNVSIKSLKYEKVETGMVGGTLKQLVKIQNGIPSDKAKEIVKYVKDLKMKVQAQIQSEQVRVQGAQIDDLQAVIAALRKNDFDLDLQFINFR